MILSTIEIVSYTSIICMILIYDTLHYDQPHASIDGATQGQPVAQETGSKKKFFV
jgi:hypothetical protein